MLIDVNKWIDKNGSFDEAGGLDLVRHGYEWIRRMRKFENKADRHTFQKVFGNKRGNELWDCFLEVGKSIFILEDSYFLINDRNVFSLCLAECSDYDLYELVHNIETDSESALIPVFADLRGNFTNGQIVPFIGLRIGYAIDVTSDYGGNGFYCNPFVGVKYMLGKQSAVNFSLGYGSQARRYSFRGHSSSKSIDGFNFKIGIEF